MKSIIAPAIAAILLASAGLLASNAGKEETRLTDAHRELLLLQYAAARSDSEKMGDSPALARVPGIGRETAADAKELRATASYWNNDYANLAPQKDTSGTVTETNAELLMLAADASFRTSQPETDRNVALRKLDGVVKSYADVLRNRAGDPDAAYNYEYAVRARDLMARAKPQAGKPANAANAAARAAIDALDVPTGLTLHGRPGGPPPKTDMSQFKIVIPKRGEERKDDPQAGKGGVKVRKG
jgi:hypothetical protein